MPEAELYVLVPGLVIPEQLARRLADVCAHSERSREAVVRAAIEIYVNGYIAGSGLTGE